MKSFKKYVLDKYLGEDSPAGDFAMDITYDKKFPVTYQNSRKKIRAYLKYEHNACQGCLTTCYKLLAEYEANIIGK